MREHGERFDERFGVRLPPFTGEPPDEVKRLPEAVAEWERIAGPLAQSGRFTVLEAKFLAPMYAIQVAIVMRMETAIATVQNPDLKQDLLNMLPESRQLCADLGRQFAVDVDERGRVILPPHLVPPLQ
jgi:hypothetical protein